MDNHQDSSRRASSFSTSSGQNASTQPYTKTSVPSRLDHVEPKEQDPLSPRQKKNNGPAGLGMNINDFDWASQSGSFQPKLGLPPRQVTMDARMSPRFGDSSVLKEMASPPSQSEVSQRLMIFSDSTCKTEVDEGDLHDPTQTESESIPTVRVQQTAETRLTDRTNGPSLHYPSPALRSMCIHATVRRQVPHQ